MELAVFSYAIVAIMSFFILCNTLASGRVNRMRMERITPITALFLGILWPIGLLAAWMMYIRNR